MKNKIVDYTMAVLILLFIVGCGALNAYIKWDRWNDCRTNHGFVYCAIRD